MEASKNKLFIISFVLVGMLLAILSVFLPLKYLVVLAGAAAAFVFTFFALEISFGAFILFMAIVPHSYWNNMLIFLASVFYLFVFILQVLAEKREGIKLKDINIFLLIFIFFGVYSVLISTHFSDSLRMFVIMLSCIMLSIVIIGIAKDKKSIDILITFIAISVLFTSLFGIYQKLTGVEIRMEFIDLTTSDGTVLRVFSTMDNPNNFAEFLVMCLPFCFSHFLNVKDELKKLIFLGITGIGVIALVYTLSRSSYIAFFIGAVVYVFLINRKLVPFCIILGIMALPLMPDFLVNRLLTLGKDSSSSYRFLIWENVFGILKDYWLQGIGMGTEVFKNIYGIYTNNAAYKAMHSHNLALHTLVEMGIGGFITFILMLFTSIKSGFVSYLKTSDPYFKNLFAAFIFSFISITVFSFGEYVWYYPRVMLTFFLVFGLNYGMIKASRSDV